jgi:photosystem II stability/assembly factor-like uncharacterized protein
MNLRLAKHIALLLLVVMHGERVFSQEQFWKQTNGPYGGTALSFATSPGGTILAGTSGGGIFRSTDCGRTWHQTPATSGIVYSMVIDSRETIYAPVSGLSRSTDDGETWTQIITGLGNTDVVACALSPSNDLYVAGTTGGGIFHSSDKGTHWAYLALSGSIIRSLAVDEHGHIFAGVVGQGMERSTDKGTTWLPTSLPDLYPYTILALRGGVVLAGTDAGILRSSDDGATWQPTNLIGRNAYSFAVNSQGYVVAAVGNNGVYRSTDSGVTWASVGLPFSDTWAIGVGPHDCILAGIEGDGIYRSDATGSIWTQTGLPSTVVWSVATDTYGDLFAGTFSGGVSRSTDGGRTWGQTGLRPQDVYAIATDSQGHIYAGCQGVYESFDKGMTWQQTNYAGPYVSCLLTPGSSVLFAGTSGGGVFRSTDAGHNWEAVNTGLNYWHITSLCASKDGHILAGTYAGLYCSSDNGDHWNLLDLLPLVNYSSLATSPNGDIFAAICGIGVFRSTDDGITWDWADSALASRDVLSLIVNRSGDVFAGTQTSGVFRTTNGGISWTGINGGLTNQSVRALTLDSRDYLFAATDGSGVFKSVKATTDAPSVSETFSLLQNYPNPFNATTMIEYRTLFNGPVHLALYNILGQRVRVLLDETQDAGAHSFRLDASGLATGVYVCQLRSGESTLERKLILLK